MERLYSHRKNFQRPQRKFIKKFPQINETQRLIMRSLDVYHNPFQFSMENSLHAYRVLLKYSNTNTGYNTPSKHEIKTVMLARFHRCRSNTDFPQRNFIMSEISDILLPYFPEEGRKLLRLINTPTHPNNTFNPIPVQHQNPSKLYTFTKNERKVTFVDEPEYFETKNVEEPERIIQIQNIPDVVPDPILEIPSMEVMEQQAILQEIMDNLDIDDDENDWKRKTVYEDEQNVHDSHINTAVLKISKVLYNTYKTVIDRDNKDKMLITIKEKLSKDFSNNKKSIKKTINFIKRSNATFGIGIRLQDVFKAVWLWIQDHSEKEELIKRFVQEIVDMEGLCTTGHLARIVNTVQGYADDERLHLTISEEGQYKSIIHNYLNNQLQKCDDDTILDGILESNKKYQKFIRKKILFMLQEWSSTYNNMIEYIPKIVNEYSRSNIFKV